MDKMAVNVRRYLIMSSILALAVSAAGCGGSSGDRSGAGGTTGTPPASGGVVGSGGTTVNPVTTGGATSTGGASTVPTLACTPGFQPAAPLITDFSATTWSGTTGKFGTTGSVTGSLFTYSSAGSTMQSMIDNNSEDLVLYGSVIAPSGYAGGGLSFEECVNTSVYTGVQFTLGGTTSGCTLMFQVQTFDEKPVDQGGGCASSCYVLPSMTLASPAGTPSPITVHFSDLTGGLPATAAGIEKEIIGLQWQFQSPAQVGDGGQPNCTGISLTIDNVSFVSN